MTGDRLSTPRALLLDFGGVLVDGDEDPDWSSLLAETVGEVLTEAGVAPLPAATIRRSLLVDDHDQQAAPFWLDPAPTQRDPRKFWSEVIAARWPAPARAAVAARSSWLSQQAMESRYAASWQLRPGMAELLADAHQRGLPMAVVSNTLSGASHRAFLRRAGVADRFVAQFYSDEEGVRKPNPQLAARAVAAVGVAAADCWFIGDTLTRDVQVARRAGIGVAVLMRSRRRERLSHPVEVTPDVTVADPTELRALLDAHLVR